MLVKPLVRSIVRSIAGRPTNSLGSGFAPTSLFSAGEQGYVYDLNDLSTLFLDSAGVTSATVNGLVGLVIDKSKAPPVARRNLLSFTEQLGAAPWSTATASVTADQIAAPDGTTTADLIAASAPSGNVRQFFTSTAGIRTFSCYVKKGNVSVITFKVINIADAFTFNLDTGLVTGGIHSGTSFVENVGSGWYRIGCWLDTGATTNYGPGLGLTSTSDTVYAWGFQMEVGSAVSAYQRVVANEGGWLPGNHAYQTTTGNKPVLRGSPIGANTVSNPNFDSATGWTTGTNWSIGSGVATSTGGNQFQALTRGDWGGVAGNWYRLTIDVSAYTSGSLLIRAGSGTNKGTISKGGVSVVYFQADGAGLSLLSNATGFEFIGSITSIEIVDVSAGQVQAPYALQFDGVDDFLQTASVNFTATDKMTVCHGVRKLSDAALGILVELSADSNANTRAFRIDAPSSPTTRSYYVQSLGTLQSSANITGYAAPVVSVVGAVLDIAGDLCRLRVNGAQVAEGLSDQGTGTYGNYALYFGRRGGASLPYNGLLYSAICVGKAVSATELAGIERWTNQRTNAY